MGTISVGPKSRVAKLQEIQIEPSIVEVIQQPIFDNTSLILQNRISELEFQLSNVKPIHTISEIVKEVIREVPIEIEVEVEKILYKSIEVIKYVEVPIHNFVEKEVEVIREVFRDVEKIISYIPRWVFGVIGIQSLIIVLMLFK